MGSCSASDTSTKRFCACAKVGVQWFVADKGQSCTDTCHARGGICGDEDQVWPTSADTLESIASYAGITCQSKQSGSESFSPSISDDGTCYWGNDPSSADQAVAKKKPFCAATDWTNSQQKRICP